MTYADPDCLTIFFLPRNSARVALSGFAGGEKGADKMQRVSALKSCFAAIGYQPNFKEPSRPRGQLA
jgi:hypothetical protein